MKDVRVASRSIQLACDAAAPDSDSESEAELEEKGEQHHPYCVQLPPEGDESEDGEGLEEEELGVDHLLEEEEYDDLDLQEEDLEDIDIAS